MANSVPVEMRQTDMEISLSSIVFYAASPHIETSFRLIQLQVQLVFLMRDL